MSSAPETATQVASPSVFLLSVTDRAVAKVKEFATKMPEAAGKPLRVFIQGGGCSASSTASRSTTSGRRTTSSP